MAKHIDALLNDEKLRGKVVKRAEQDIAAATWEAAAAKVVEVYRELL